MAKRTFDIKKLLRILTELCSQEKPDSRQVNDGKADRATLKTLVKLLGGASQRLSELRETFDEIELPRFVFNLHDPNTLGEVIAYKLEQTEKQKIEGLRKFYGSGVYAFYYGGDLEYYRAIRGSNCPIYVGSAGPLSKAAETVRQQGTRLFDRIFNDHLKKSLRRSGNLRQEDFLCRFLVVQSGLEKAAEDFLIHRYRPVWNKEVGVCSGFGKHGDIARKELSVWDILHGQRVWTVGQSSRSGITREIAQERIQEHFRSLLRKDPESWKTIFNADWLHEQST